MKIGVSSTALKQLPAVKHEKSPGSGMAAAKEIIQITGQISIFSFVWSEQHGITFETDRFLQRERHPTI